MPSTDDKILAIAEEMIEQGDRHRPDCQRYLREEGIPATEANVTLLWGLIKLDAPRVRSLG